jgi:hypothetical protein
MRTPPDPPDHSLGCLDRYGIARLEFHCLGEGCGAVRRVALRGLLQRYGASTSLEDLARRGKCRQCGHRGAQVQPSLEFDRRAPDHRDRATRRALALYAELELLFSKDERH